MANDDKTTWLEAYVKGQGGVAGSLHEVRGEAMHLVAAYNIPDKVQDVTRVIPKGKGMGGLAWLENRPVSTCNLQTDTSGAVKPGAKAVNAAAAVAFPVHDAEGGIRAVVGVAFANERELGDAELAAITQAASNLPS